MRRYGQGYGQVTDQLSVHLRLDVIPGDSCRRRREERNSFHSFGNAAEYSEGQQFQVAQTIDRVDKAHLKLRTIQTRSWRDGKIAAIVRRLAYGGKGGRVLLAVDLHKEVSGFPTDESFQTGIPECRLSQPPFQRGTNAVDDRSIHPDACHKQKVAPLTSTFDLRAAGVNALNVSAGDDFCKTFQFRRESQLPSPHIGGSARPDGEPGTGSDKALQCFVNRTVPAGDNNVADAFACSLHGQASRIVWTRRAFHFDVHTTCLKQPAKTTDRKSVV